MKVIADVFNEAGRRSRWPGMERFLYATACRLAPRWPAPWFNRGLLAKRALRWDECRALNRRAVELGGAAGDPAWWNLGIAATALGDWETARAAWAGYGIEVPPGSGPLDMHLGQVPIRVAPDEHPEVVWCRRLDPARAVIESVPLPECGRGWGDTVLHDGEPRGQRMLNGHAVPVFDELQVLERGSHHTFQCIVVAPAASDVEELVDSQEEAVVVEDWHSSIQRLCRACSEGLPHAHDGHDADGDWEPRRTLGMAARSEEAARGTLDAWIGRGPGREASSFECLMRRA